jgi:hypothetical protein
MNTELRKEFEQYEEMFQTDAWMKLIENATEQHKIIMESAVRAAPTNDQWQFLRGQITQLEQLLGFESYVVNTLQYDDEGNADDLTVSDLEA